MSRTRHNQLYETVILEKTKAIQRHNFLADETFNEGQQLLSDIKTRLTLAEQKKNQKIEKKTQRT